MNVQLQDAIWEQTQGYLAIPSLSRDGKRAYVVYQINADATDQKAAELFAIESGKFVSLATFTSAPDDPFFATLSGFANDDFTEFTLLRSNNQDGLAGLYQLSLLRYDGSSDLQVVRSTQKSAFVTGYTPFGASYVAKGKYIVVTAVTEDSPTNQVSSMWLFDRNLLVRQRTSSQEVFTTQSYPFVKDGLNYFAIVSASGRLDFIDPAAAWQPPFQLRVFVVVDDRFSLVASAPLPQGSLAANAYSTDCETLLSVGTFTALKAGEVSIAKHTDLNTSATPDERELRIYRFDSKTLTLQKAEDTDATMDSVFINRDLFIRSVNSGPYAEGDPSFFTIQSRSGCGRLYSGVINNTPIFAASTDGKVLVAGSASRPEYNNNLLLFSVSN